MFRKFQFFISYLYVCIFLLLMIIFVGCETASGPGANDLKQELMNEPAHNFESFRSFFDPSSKLVERVRANDDFILDYLKDFDNDDSYEFYQPTQQEIDLLDKYFELLPSKYIDILKARLVGVYFIENYVASGMTEFVLRKDKDEVYCFMVFNSNLINVPMDEWISKKENTCFIDTDPNLNIAINIDSPYTGLLYILIHECTHVMDYATSITPYVEPDIGTLYNTLNNTSAFTDNVWAEYRIPFGINAFGHRDKISFYGFKNGPLLADTNAVELYMNFSKSRFVSLYGSSNWAEDLAEYMTFYHLTQKLGLDYSINVNYHKSLKFSYRPFENADIISRIHDLPDFY
jgi:hypothetical protein